MSQTRLIQHVNDQDEVLGWITPEQRADHHIYRVSALWLTNSQGDILIAQRNPNMNNSGGLWGPAAAGTVEAGESYHDNIVKEAAEEIGLTGIEFTPGPKVFIGKDEPGRTYFCKWFFATCDWPVEQFVLEPEEVSAIRLLSPAKLKSDIKDHPEYYLQGAHRWIGRFI